MHEDNLFVRIEGYWTKLKASQEDSCAEGHLESIEKFSIISMIFFNVISFSLSPSLWYSFYGSVLVF